MPTNERGLSTTARNSWRGRVIVLPGLSIALLPKLACPACWPLYAGVLGSMGLNFVNYTAFVVPLTVGFLLLALSSLGYRAAERRGYSPLVAGIGAAAVVLFGQFVIASEPVVYGGVVLLMGVSLWNAWPKRATTGSVSCPACATAAPLTACETNHAVHKGEGR
ncbi:hypothetical protein BH23GEM7_BH23GEM7_34250 [soil metagenome]